MLTVVDAGVAFGPIQALSSVSVRVERNQLVTLIGSNGAGKSTLLNAISGVHRLGAGTIDFDGTRLSGLKPHQIARLGILHVPEGRQILGPLTVDENLRIGAVAARGRGGRLDAEFEQVFDLFPLLAERRHQLAGHLSGGQQQMVAIGRALMGRPRLLLLDEPSLGLAPIVVTEVFQALKRLHAEGLTIFLVEQNAARALEIASLAYVLQQGRVVREGPTEQLLKDPAMVEYYLGQAANQSGE